jgi:hypothetical protein
VASSNTNDLASGSRVALGPLERTTSAVGEFELAPVAVSSYDDARVAHDGVAPTNLSLAGLDDAGSAKDAANSALRAAFTPS